MSSISCVKWLLIIAHVKWEVCSRPIFLVVREHIAYVFYTPLGTGSDGVPSPPHVSKSQHGGIVPTFGPQETIKYINYH